MTSGTLEIVTTNVILAMHSAFLFLRNAPNQVQNGVERHISYVSRQMNRAEQAYCASESEMLALVWATTFFPLLPPRQEIPS